MNDRFIKIEKKTLLCGDTVLWKNTVDKNYQITINKNIFKGKI